MAKFYQFTVPDIYNKVTNGDGKTSPMGPELPNIDAICPEFLLMFGQNLLLYGFKSVEFHATLLEIEPSELRYGLKLLTGMKFSEFTEDFMLIEIRKAVGNFPERGKVKEIAKRFGFSDSGFYRFMKRKMKRTPSGWHWYL